MEKIEGNILLDFDETLVSTLWCQSQRHVDKNIRYFSKRNPNHVSYTLGEGGKYLTFLRPLAFELINYCEQIVGEDNVYILTLGTEEYANTAVKLLGLVIPEHRIYSREYLHIDVPKFKGTNNVLIDNESYEYHTEGSVNKVNFLYKLPPSKYVKVDPYSIQRRSDPSDYVNVIKSKIIDALKTTV